MSQLVPLCILILAAVYFQSNNASEVEQFDYLPSSDIEITDTWTQKLNNDVGRIAECDCSGGECECCLKHRFTVKVLRKHYHLNLDACLWAKASGDDIIVEFKVNGKKFGSRRISPKRIPKLCYMVPGLGKLAEACIDFYDVNASSKRMCTKLILHVNVLFKKFHFSHSLGCFTVPTLADDNVMLSDGSIMVNDDDDRMLATPFYYDEDALDWE